MEFTKTQALEIMKQKSKEEGVLVESFIEETLGVSKTSFYAWREIAKKAFHDWISSHERNHRLHERTCFLK